jgi:hypothetical protein
VSLDDDLVPLPWWWNVYAWLRWQNPIRRAWLWFVMWRARRICNRIGHDMEGGDYRGEFGTAYWYRCRRCDDQGSSE